MNSSKPYSFFWALIICFSSINSTILSAQKQYKYTQLSTEKGLAHNLCRAAYKDARGFLWFGTQDGLSRFDGTDFKNFKHNETDSTSISSNTICDIAADKSGKCWLAINGSGLSCFDPLSIEHSGFQQFTTPVHPITKTTGFPAKSVCVDRQDRVWLGTYNNGLYAFDKNTKTFTQFDLGTPLEVATDAFKFNSINDLQQDVQNDATLWLGSNHQTHSLFRFDIKTQKRESFPVKAASITLFMDKPNELWVGTWGNGLVHFNTLTKKIDYYGDDLAKLGKDFNSNVITGIARRNDHELWVASLKNGLWLFDEIQKKFYHLPELNSPTATIFGNETGGVFTDKTANLVYFFDNVRGITAFKENPDWVQYHTIEECAVIHQNEVNNFVWDEQTKRLFLTMQGCHVLAAFDENNKQLPIKGLEYTVFYPSGKKDKTEVYKDFNCITMNRLTQKLWLGSNFSKDSPYTLFSLDPATLTLTPLSIKALNDLNIHQNAIKNILQDKNGCIWIAASQLGLLRYNPATEQVLIVPNTDKMNIVELKEDTKGNIWVTTKLYGILQINAQTAAIKYYFSLKNDKNKNNTFDFYATQEADDGMIWMATHNHGILVVDPQKLDAAIVKIHTLEDGLPSMRVTNIIKDAKGLLWISTMNGLCFYDPVKKSFHQLGFGESLDDLIMRRKGLAFGQKGVLLLGLNKNFLSINVDKRQERSLSNLPIQFTDFKIFEKPVSFGRPLSNMGQIDLQPDQNFFTVSFSSMKLALNTTQYRYKMLGFDKNWIYAGTRNTATYTNLPDGKYTLQVQCTDEEGIWQESVAELHLNIVPPYYRTWWFLSLVFLLISSLIYGFYQFRIKQFREKEMLKTTLNKRIAEIKLEALSAQMNPHFIFNSLTSINLFILKNESEAASFYLNKFSRLIRQVLDHSRTETITLAEDLETLKLYVELEKLRFGKDFNYSFDIDNQLDTHAIHLPPLLIQPLVENAIWHGLKHKVEGVPMLKIKAFAKDNKAFIEVEDNGIGRKKSAELKKERVDEHTSHGLNVTQERLKLFNETHEAAAEIEVFDLVDTEEGALGTKATFTLMLRFSK
jgi:ligand-binding sensor domain-containing protein